MKIHHKLRSTDACFLFLTFRLPNWEASSENNKLPSLKQEQTEQKSTPNSLNQHNIDTKYCPKRDTK